MLGWFFVFINLIESVPRESPDDPTTHRGARHAGSTRQHPMVHLFPRGLPLVIGRRELPLRGSVGRGRHRRGQSGGEAAQERCRERRAVVPRMDSHGEQGARSGAGGGREQPPPERRLSPQARRHVLPDRGALPHAQGQAGERRLQARARQFSTLHESNASKSPSRTA